MNRRQFLGAAAIGTASLAASRTVVSIRGDQFLLNGTPTYPGRTWQGHRIEGLLMNSRVVQGIFDDENSETRGLWAYPDSGKWDAERNTREFVAAMPAWRAHGLLSFDICLQGGNPHGYRKDQPWRNSAYRPDGSLKPGYMERLGSILDRADELGMAPIVCLFYFGQDEHFLDEAAIRRATRDVTTWLSEREYRHILVEIANECNNLKYDHAILKPDRILELFDVVRKVNSRFPVSTSFNGRTIPPENIVAASDFVLLHGNGVKDPKIISRMVEQTRSLKTFRTMPVLFNEDDHFDFEQPENNMLSAIRSYASWGLLDIEGYQRPPVNWGIDTERKEQFFTLLKQITGA